MNRKERRRLERQGKIPVKEPVYTMKRSEVIDSVLNGPGKTAMEDAIRKQILEMDTDYTINLDTMVLATLHHDYGFGVKRCKEFYIRMFRRYMEMRKRYEMKELYPERKFLKEDGIDVEAWYNTLFNSDGSFKNPEDITL